VSGRRFIVLVAEMQDLVPRRRPNLPNVMVTVVDQPDGSVQAAFEKRRKSKRYYAEYLLQPLSTIPPQLFDRREDAKAHAQKTAFALAVEGYTVNPNPKTQYSIYVVRLHAGMLGRPEQKCVYVGETSKSTAERIAEHRAGGPRAARTWRAFLGRAKNLEPPLKPIHSKYDALAEEIAWGKHLRSLGYHVKGPTLGT